MTATAVAHPNIALVKYWGKADAQLALPATGSVSMGLDVFPTTTTVTLDGAAAADSLVLNGGAAPDGALLRVQQFLDLVRRAAGSSVHAAVVSENTVPTGAGLASSASGFAALATAAAAAYGLDLSERDLSRLARRGSGSATRSIPGGVAVWHAGDDQASFAERVPAPPMAMVVVTISAGEKAIGSREAMRRTIATSPFYPGVGRVDHGHRRRHARRVRRRRLRPHRRAHREQRAPHARHDRGRVPADPLPERPERRRVRRRRRTPCRRADRVRHGRRRPERRRAHHPRGPRRRRCRARADLGDVIESGTGPGAHLLRSEGTEAPGAGAVRPEETAE